MGITEMTNDASSGAYCTRKRRDLIQDLESLDDTGLQEIGVWRGAISDTVTDLLKRQGCTTSTHIHSRINPGGDMQ